MLGLKGIIVNIMENYSISLLNDYYGNLLTDRQKEMLELFYDFDMSLGEIAEQFSVSRQAVRDSILRGEKALQNFEDKLGLLKKNIKLNNAIDELNKTLNENKINNARLCVEKIKAILED